MGPFKITPFASREAYATAYLLNVIPSGEWMSEE